MNNQFKRALKILLIIITSIILLVIIAVLALNLPAVQNIIKNKVITYLKKKTDTEIRLEKIHIGFPNEVQLDKFYIADKRKDTLLYAERLSVDLDILKILSNHVELNNIELQKVRANIHRLNPDTIFNYQFLVDSLVSNEKNTSNKKSAPLKFDLDKILFDDVRLKYQDDVAGNNAGIFIGRLNAHVTKFDLAEQHYVLDNFQLDTTTLFYYQIKPLTVLQQAAKKSVDEAEQKNKGKLPLIEFKNFAFNKVYFDYDDKLSDTKATLNLQDMQFKNLFLDLTKGMYKSTGGALNNSVIAVAYRPTPTNEKAVKTVADSAKNSSFSLYLDKIMLANNTINYDNLSQPVIKSRLDFNHLHLRELGISGNNIAIDSSGILAQVAGGKFKDSSGFVVNDLQGKVVYNDDQLRIDNLQLRTPGSYINNSTLLTYNSRDDLSKHPEKVRMAVNLRNSVISMGDLYYLVHSVPASYRSQRLSVSAALTGYLNDVNIDKLQASGLQSTQIDITGNIKNITNIDRALFNVNIHKLQTSKRDITAFVAPKSLPQNINLPNYIAATGKFTGTMKAFNTNLNIKTDMGSARVTGTMNLAKNRETYNAKVSLNNFNLGRLLKRQDIGRVSMAANINGRGLSAKTANAKIHAVVQSAYYNQYNYNHITIDGTYAHQNLNARAVSNDPNARFDITINNLNTAGKNPSINGVINLQNIDLHKLHFTTTPLQLSGIATVNFTNVNPDYLNGTAYISNLEIIKDGQKLQADTVSLVAVSNSLGNTLDLSSDILTAHLEGKYQLTQLHQAFINEINKYYTVGVTKKINAQDVRFRITLYESPIIQAFVPKLTHFSTATINGLLNTQTDSLLVNGLFPNIIYDSMDLKNLALDINNRSINRLDYNLHLQSIESPSIQFYNSSISGNAANDILQLNALLKDSRDKEKYMAGGQFKVINQTYQFTLDPDKLILNYDKWTVAPNNMIQYGKSGVLIRDFSISNKGQSLTANTTNGKANGPVKVAFNNFKLETLTRYAEQDTSLVGGTLNGTANISEITSTPKLEANLTIDSLRFKKDKMGNARIEVNNYNQNGYYANVTLSGIHDVSLKGYYYTKPSGSLDMQVDIRKINLQYIESLAAGQIKNGSGYLSGNISVKGPASAPKILGNLTFNDAAFAVSKLNAYFRINKQTINIAENGIYFNHFTILDSLNQEAIINGAIRTTDYKDFAFDMTVNAENFKVMNSTAADNKLFYGVAYLDIAADIKGSMNNPDIHMSTKINKDTRFTFVLPAKDPEVVSQEGIVQFIDMDNPPVYNRDTLNVDSATLSKIRGLNIVGDLTIDKDAQLTVIVDPQNGDALNVKGQGDLSFQIDPSGKTSLTGRYELSEGSYDLSIGGLARRKFKIQQGSSLVWTGAPTEANIDITAVYEANVSPIDLVADQVQSLDDYTRNTYKQRLPFYVYLKMTGELLKPIVHFELDMAENERNAFNGIVYTRIQQINTNESELNKQVLALLAFNRFVSDNPFESLAGGNFVSRFARQSVSSLLTQQLNNLTSDLIHGVDLSFEVNSSEDYTTGTMKNRTDLNVALSKRLLNDRLSVSVGNNFVLEGPKAQGQDNVNIASNVNIEYMLSRDGRYRLRAYRRNQTEGIIEGEIIETGVGFVMIVDYNRFREIFDSFKKRSEDRKRQKANDQQK